MGMTDKQFKAYIKELLNHYEDLEEAIDKNDIKQAKKIIERLKNNANSNLLD